MTVNMRPGSFLDYLNEVDAFLEAEFGVTSSDGDMEGIATAQEAGDTPAQHAAWLAAHHTLQPVHPTTANPRRNS